jgi:hypothetical protein
MAETGMRIGGTSEQQVGEGRADAPVGTTLAMIEQATKVMNSVHKRMHAAQAEEFQMLARLFKENPESFWQRNKRPAKPWDEQTFLRALNNCELVPQADPNTASHAQRVMKIMALKQLQAANPSMYDPIAIDTAALQAVGWSNPEQFMIPASARGAPPPQMMQEMAKLQIQKQDADTKAQAVQGKIALDQARVQLDMAKAQHEAQGGLAGPQEKTDHEKQVDGIELILKEKLADAKMMDVKLKAAGLASDMKRDAFDNQLKREDMLAKERIQMVDLAQNIAVHPESETVVRNLLGNVIPAITGAK